MMVPCKHVYLANRASQLHTHLRQISASLQQIDGGAIGGGGRCSCHRRHSCCGRRRRRQRNRRHLKCERSAASIVSRKSHMANCVGGSSRRGRRHGRRRCVLCLRRWQRFGQHVLTRRVRGLGQTFAERLQGDLAAALDVLRIGEARNRGIAGAETAGAGQVRRHAAAGRDLHERMVRLSPDDADAQADLVNGCDQTVDGRLQDIREEAANKRGVDVARWATVLTIVAYLANVKLSELSPRLLIPCRW